jgi:hypothetical protein
MPAFVGAGDADKSWLAALARRQPSPGPAVRPQRIMQVQTPEDGDVTPRRNP